MDPSPFRIQMFGTFRVIRGDGTSVKFATTKSAQIIAALVLSRHSSLSRAELADMLWPDVDPESQKTSLRTALSQLRRAADESSLFDADRESVWLVAGQSTSDLQRAAHLRRTVQLLTVAEEQIEPLRELVSLTSEPLLGRWDDSWVEGARRDWTERWLRATKSLQVIAEARGQWEDVLELSERALSRVPFDETAIARAMRAEAAMGNPELALSRFQRSEEVIRTAIGRHPSEALRSVFDSIRAGTVHPQAGTPSVSTGEEGGLLSESFFAWLQLQPDTALATLNDMLYSRVGNRQPLASWRIMDRALRETQGTSEARMRSAAVCAWFAMQAERLEDCTHWNNFILSNRPADHPQALNAHNRLGVVAYYRGQLEEARRHHEQTLALARAQGNEFMEAMSLVNVRNLDILEGRTQGAVELFDEIASRILKLPHENPLILVAPIRSFQAVACLHQGDYSQALRLATQAHEVAEVNGISNFGSESLGLMGLAHFQLGDRQQGAQLILEGVRQAIQYHYESASERLMRLAGYVIAACGHPQQGANIIEATNSFCLGRGIRPFPADLAIGAQIYGARLPQPTWREGTRAQLHTEVLSALADVVDA